MLNLTLGHSQKSATHSVAMNSLQSMPMGGGDILTSHVQSQMHTANMKMQFALVKNSARQNAQHQCDMINLSAKYFKAVVK